MRTLTRSPDIAAVGSGWRPFAFAFAAYSALAITLTFPLVLHLSSVMPHDIGDPLLSASILWWSAHVMPFTERWWNGFAFYPAPGFLGFSDPRVGESLIATPLQWLGCSPVAAYNLTLLATYPLCALAAHWLGFVLTGRHDAAAISGLAFGFCPFRVAHLPHLELLAAFGMPAALAALHLYRNTQRRRWLAVFALALVVQGYCSSYYLLFFSVLVGLWLLWFTRRDDVGFLIGVMIAGVCALAALAPLAIGYSRIHAHYGFSRGFDEVLTYSADATSIFTAHATTLLWSWTARWSKSEGELFPGGTITLLALAGVILAWRRGAPRDRFDRWSIWLLPLAGVAATIAFCGWAFAPWRVAFAGVRISSDAPFKPMTMALVAVAIWLGVSSRMRVAYMRRTPFAFYVIATVVLFLCSMGPKPTFAGHQFLYESPYLWLMKTPLFASVRAPARFGLPMMLALATASALAFNQLRLQGTARRVLAVALLAGIAADGWISPLMLPSVPDTWTASRADGFAAVLELPLGDVMGDLAATYRASDHGHPIVNGSSGFEPPHYLALRTALEERDPTAFDGLPTTGRILVVVDRRNDPDLEWDRFLTAHPRVTRLTPDNRWAFYALDPPPVDAPPCTGDPTPIVSLADDDKTADLSRLTDGNPHTFWAAQHPLRNGDNLVLDLGRTVHPCALFVSVGEFRKSYPRYLIVHTSVDGVTWTVAGAKRTAGLTVRAALEDPTHVSIPISLTPGPARFMKLLIGEMPRSVPWRITDLSVRSARSPE